MKYAQVCQRIFDLRLHDWLSKSGQPIRECVNDSLYRITIVSERRVLSRDTPHDSVSLGLPLLPSLRLTAPPSFLRRSLDQNDPCMQSSHGKLT